MRGGKKERGALEARILFFRRKVKMEVEGCGSRSKFTATLQHACTNFEKVVCRQLLFTLVRELQIMW